jgi:hypothetical protein
MKGPQNMVTLRVTAMNNPPCWRAFATFAAPNFICNLFPTFLTLYDVGEVQVP